MRDPRPNSKRSLELGAQIMMPEALQMPFCPTDFYLCKLALRRELALVQHIQEDDFAIERLREAVGQLEDFQRTLRQINRQQQPIGFDPEMLT